MLSETTYLYRERNRDELHILHNLEHQLPLSCKETVFVQGTYIFIYIDTLSAL